MSFSSEVKQELAKQSGKSRHCQIAELAALVAFDGKRQQLIEDAGDVLDSENPLAGKIWTVTGTAVPC